MKTTTSPNNTILALALLAVLAVVAFALLNMPDRRSPGEKIGDAVDTLAEGEGLGKAARELEDRTPAERIGDAAKDVVHQ